MKTTCPPIKFINTQPNKLSTIYTFHIPKLKPLPRYCFFTKTKTNQVVEEETIFRTVPYLGDNIALDLKIFGELNTPGEIEHEVLGEAEEYLVFYYFEENAKALEFYFQRKYQQKLLKLQSNTPPPPSQASSILSVCASTDGNIGGLSYDIYQGEISAEICVALSLVLEVSKNEVMKAYKRISDGKWFRNFL